MSYDSQTEQTASKAHKKMVLMSRTLSIFQSHACVSQANPTDGMQCTSRFFKLIPVPCQKSILVILVTQNQFAYCIQILCSVNTRITKWTHSYKPCGIQLEMHGLCNDHISPEAIMSLRGMIASHVRQMRCILGTKQVESCKHADFRNLKSININC